MSQTLFDRIWDLHEVSDGLLYIDLHLVHEVTSPQAFDGLRLAGRPVRRPDRTLATADHNVPTDGTPVAARIRDELSRVQVETLERNCEEFGIPIYSMGSDRQGIVHVIGPELGVTQPGMTIVCGDSHTATHGAFGALAFGIGTSEVEHVLATQCLAQRKPRSMRIRYEGEPGFGVTAKDLILGTIGQMGTNGAAGHVVEYAGPAIEALSMEGRMTICNMTIEGGGKAGMIAPDDTTLEWIEGRPGAPQDFDAAVERWRELRTDDDATFDRELTVDAAALSPLVTWGTTPAMVVPVTGVGARPAVRRRRARAEVHGARGRDADAGHPPRPRLHRLVHELADRRPARRRRARRGPQGRLQRRRHGRPGLPARRPPGRGGGARRRLPRRRLRLALRRLLDVPGDEPRHPPARRALRVDLEPQLRGPPGPRRAHAPRLAPDGRRRRHRGPLRRHPQGSREPTSCRPHHGARQGHLRRRVRARPRGRRHRPDHPQAVPQAGRADRLRRVPLLRLGQGARLGPAVEPDPRHRAELRLAGRAASTRRGRSRTTASRPSSRRPSPTSSSPTARSAACCRSCCPRRRSGR